MAARDLAVGTTFLLQTIFGILGNFCILYHCFLLYCAGYRLRTIDFIVRNLITANILVLFSTGFHSEKFGVAPHGQWFYVQIFPVCSCGGQGSVHWHHLPLECLPGHQISPRTSRWAKLKVNALKCFVPPVILCWILNMLNTENIVEYRETRASQTEKVSDTVRLFVTTKPETR
ncbi:hypothetical protein E2I00_010198 [Balaenoptera physalus]|uniref:Vomeronasal type-1 receptor n=1 Tax=Balaenoptera physalus TaxID=9770 RepID=A0A643BW44_BALPH|nr:hypothetical protein E2I00_010198 [Balaenoptera physalus]